VQVTIDSSDPLDKALRVVSSLYGVELTVTVAGAPAAAAAEPAPQATRRPAKKTAKKATKKAVKKATKKATKAAPAPGRPRRARRATRSAEELVAIRAWARDNGYNVSDRGRVSNAVLAAYEAANPSS
jgi:hypothetical protein